MTLKKVWKTAVEGDPSVHSESSGVCCSVSHTTGVLQALLYEVADAFNAGFTLPFIGQSVGAIDIVVVAMSAVMLVLLKNRTAFHSANRGPRRP